MYLTLTIKNWEEVFHIYKIDIADELDWDYHCFAKGTVDDDTEATLSLVQISKLSTLDSDTILELFQSLKGNRYEV